MLVPRPTTGLLGQCDVVDQQKTALERDAQAHAAPAVFIAGGLDQAQAAQDVHHV